LSGDPCCRVIVFLGWPVRIAAVVCVPIEEDVF
jgi:hypothetical protein